MSSRRAAPESSVAPAEAERVERPRAVVWQVFALRLDRLHRRGQLERQLARGPRPAGEHVDQRRIAHAEIRDQRASLVLEWRENGGPIEVDRDDRRHDGTHAPKGCEVLIVVLESQSAFVEELAEHILRVQTLEWRIEPD